jgi:hypothetical protein
MNQPFLQGTTGNVEEPKQFFGLSAEAFLDLNAMLP